MEMSSIFKKTTASMAENEGAEPNHQYDVVEDLTTWELVSSSPSDDEEVYSFDGDDIISEGDDATGDEHRGNYEEEEEEGSRDSLHLDDVISMQSLSVSPPPLVCVSFGDVMRSHAYDDECDDNDVYDDDDDDGGGGPYDDDVDDELIPWKLKGIFGKQRIRKMGKRGGPKSSKSKKMPHYHNRPGCLYGKHGLGVQHSYI